MLRLSSSRQSRFQIGFRKKLLFLLCPVSCYISNSSAQSNSNQLWFTYNQQVRISKKWGYILDLENRIAIGEQIDFLQSGARLGATYFIKDNSRITAGYAWFGQFLPDKDIELLSENRFWQQYAFINRIKPLTIAHRFRLEERFREVLPNSNSPIKATRYTTRLRYSLQFQGPLIKPKSDIGFAMNWQVANEIMLHAGEGVGKHHFDQNRTLGGVVISPNRKIDIVLLYQYIVQNLPLQSTTQDIHSIRLTLLHHIDLRRKNASIRPVD